MRCWALTLQSVEEILSLHFDSYDGLDGELKVCGIITLEYFEKTKIATDMATVTGVNTPW